jgi:molybdopterin molybdotransferase
MIATGSELVSPNTSPQHAQIRNSNSSQLCAQIRAIGAIATDYGVAHDTFEATCALITQAKEANHVVVLSGGASSGDFDFVPASLRHCGFQLDFDSIAMQPGRPTLFGHQTASWCFGLPGNPVSTFVIFESMLVPFLYQLMGHTYQPRIVELELVETIRRRRANRQSTLPVRLVSPSKIAPIDYHGSAHIHAMTQADALITLPIDCYEIQAGTKVHARLL